VTEGDNPRNPDHSREYWRRNAKTHLVSITIRLFKNSKTSPIVNNSIASCGALVERESPHKITDWPLSSRQQADGYSAEFL
jgi:hypothetical protein